MQPDLIMNMPTGDAPTPPPMHQHDVGARLISPSEPSTSPCAPPTSPPITGETPTSDGINPSHGKRWRRPSSTTWHLVALLGDGLLLITLSVWLLPMPYLGLSASNNVFDMSNAHFIWLCVVFAAWSFAASITGVQQLRCAASLLKGPMYAVCALVLALICSVALLYLFIGAGVLAYIRPLLIFLLVAAVIFSLWRLALAESINLPRFRRRAVIVGVNPVAQSVAEEFAKAKHPGANVVGYIGEGTILIQRANAPCAATATQSGSQQGSVPREQQDDLPVLGGRSVLHNLVQNGLLDMIIMAIDYKANPELFQEALAGAQHGVAVVPVTTVYESTSGKIPVEDIGDQWHTALATQQDVTVLYICWHRAMDLVFGICGLLLLGVTLPVLAPLIKLDSPGPLFFRQERVGYRGRIFRMWKFRSMRSDAEGAGAWTTRGDARITRVGRVLRATHMDELPQVLNILRGDMSLIGPRPERPDYV
ncbi:MAG TPA: sugar transferase, partial [Ktedonobacteraceae bacterium]|nr:sugar transferase [Ktedonobacteraceae bacterium]